MCRGGLALLAMAAPLAAAAGPPYVTDDPEPVEYRHWEVYLASQLFRDPDGLSATAPHVEVNYGAVPEVQLHLIAPLVVFRPTGGNARYGYGDTELGAKIRFVGETPSGPQIGTFVLVEVPTGDASRGLGSGSAQVFLPLWFQKSFGPWTTYGGGGYWVNPGPGNLDWWYVGWQAQRRIGDRVFAGAEIFHSTPRVEGTAASTRFNVGLVVDVSEIHHLLFSAGHSLFGPDATQAYAAYQATFGPAQ